VLEPLEPVPALAARQARPGLARAAADVTPASPRRGLSVPSANAGLQQVSGLPAQVCSAELVVSGG
jgi:hypothetical protein